jgi:thiol-disulfide isomerase/thioredoxin
MKVAVKENAFKEAKVMGSKSQNENEELQSKLNKVRNRWKVVFDTLSAVNKRSNFQFQELKNWVLKPYEAEVEEIHKEFLETHPASYVSPLALRSLAGELTADSLAMYYNRFPQGVKNTSFGKTVKEELERRKIGVPGTFAAGFSATDINGNKLDLADYKGKYVLLDFWASWCVPCRKGNPHLLSLYSKYKDKGFEIIGVASDDGKEEAWRKAVEQDKIGVWKHVLSGYDQEKRMRGEKNENYIGPKYGIATLPTKILIDPNGMIIGRYGESTEDVEAMDKKLSEIFGTI